MEKALNQKIDRLQRTYEALKEEMMRPDQSGLNQPPKPGKWSALQIVYHLYLSETLSVSYLEKKISSGPHPSVGISGSIRFILLKAALATPLKFKAPAAVGENIPDSIEIETLFQDYDKTRENLLTLLSAFPASRRREAIYKHPFIGYLTINQAVDFLYEHFAHHEKQIRAIITK